MSNFNFKAVGHNIVVKAPKISEKTESGIIKPESIIKEEKSKLNDFLEVLSVGNEVKEISVGDEVLLNGGSMRATTIDDIDVLIVYANQIIGKKL